MKVLSAYTYEIDRVDIAVSEILSQLNLKENLCKNAVGIVTCYTEYLESGVIKALDEALPFEIMGCTTLASGIVNKSGLLMLSLMVLTGDDVVFSSVLSGSLFDEQEKPLIDAYNTALAALGESPSMVMTFAPFIHHVGGELIADILDKACGGIPLFGTLAIDHTRDYHESQTIFRGAGYLRECVVLLISGNIHPRFFVASISEQKAQKQKAIITESSGNILKAVNGMSFLEYLHTFKMDLGDDSSEGLNTVPILVDYNDGTPPVARAIYILSEEGNAICGGRMPVNSTLAIGNIDYTEVVESSNRLAEEMISTAEGCNGAMLFTCLSRSLVLGSDALAEINAVQKAISDRIPYIMAYSGGEICPVYNKEGTVNRFHNFSLIACIF